jgi:hypothetical protein
MCWLDAAGSAFAEYGRIAKTMHLLAVVDPVDDTYRRVMNQQLTVQDSRHILARSLCHGRRGQIHQVYRDGWEDQLGSLGLALNAVMLWNSRYLDAAVAQRRAQGHEVKDEGRGPTVPAGLCPPQSAGSESLAGADGSMWSLVAAQLASRFRASCAGEAGSAV